MQRLHTFTLQALQKVIKIAERYLPLSIIIYFYLCSVQPFYGLSRKIISGYSHYARYFFVLF
nr:MAG TPA_asm: hypothetical protein [Caudoviricetes sp.]